LNYRKTTLYTQADATTAKTEPIDLDLEDIISRLTVRFEPTNNGHVQTAHPAKCVSKIELVDGSDVLMSLSGMQAQALDFYDTKKPRPYELDYRNDLPDQEVFNFNFGRKLFDPELAFDPNRFSNPQLKVTHDKSLGGSAPDAAKLTVIADVFDEKVPTPMGWLMAKEFFTYTPTASSYKTIDLPDDYVLRKMLVQAMVAGYSFTDLVDELRIDENNLKKIPVDLNMFMLMCSIMQDYPIYEELISFWNPNVGTYNVYVTPGEYAYLSLNPVGAATPYMASEGSGGRTTVYSAAAQVFRAISKGYMPHGCLPLAFGDQDDPANWYDITKIGALKMRLHHPATVSGSCNVILQQLRKY